VSESTCALTAGGSGIHLCLFELESDWAHARIDVERARLMRGIAVGADSLSDEEAVEVVEAAERRGLEHVVAGSDAGGGGSAEEHATAANAERREKDAWETGGARRLPR
jgi:hypothetical protein